MAKQHHYYPPVESRAALWRRRMLRYTVNLFAAIAIGALYYLLFSYLFDTPEERKMRQSTQALRKEYNLLNDRLAEVEGILDNVVERDRNVFHILFESEPYDLGSGFEDNRWKEMEKLMGRTNNELGELYGTKTEHLAWYTDNTYRLFDRIYDHMAARGDTVRNIPSMQPILNKELTLLTASFGRRIQPYYKVLTMHNGVDYTVPEGTAVFATADGRVETVVNRAASTGNSIVINHGNGYKTYYNHLSSIAVKKNDRVSRGDLIAQTGNTGLSLLPHLHYEVRLNDEPVDPIHYFFGELGPKEYNRIIKIAQSGMQSFD